MLLKPNLNLLNASRIQYLLPPIPTFAGLTDVQLSNIFTETRNVAITAILAGNNLLNPEVTFPEKHPYTDEYQLVRGRNVCIIGTCPPYSYLKDQYPPLGIQAPRIPFFHGNRCDLWKLADPNLQLQLSNHNPPTRIQKLQAVINFLEEKEVNYLDVVYEWQRLKWGFADADLRNISGNLKGVRDLIENKSENGDILLFNTSSTFGVAGLQFQNGIFNPANRSFDIFLWCLTQLGYDVSFQHPLNNLWIPFNNQNAANILTMKNKLIFNIKISGKQFIAVTGPSPANTLGLGGNAVYQACILLFGNPGHNNFKKFVYRNVVARNLAPLWTLNQPPLNVIN